MSDPVHVRRMTVGKWLWPLVGAGVCLGFGIASGLSSAGGGDAWYQQLAKPPGTPPPWVFGPVWSVLYVMMGLALGRLISRGADVAVWAFCIQFALNLAWTPVFFGAKQIGLALVVILLILLGVVVTLRLGWKSDPVSGWLLAPYLGWVGYATYLNSGFFLLNR